MFGSPVVSTLPAYVVPLVWTSFVIIFLAFEGMTAGLTSIWFALGALVALIAYFIGAPIWLQVVLFIVVTGVTLVLTRPLAKKFINKKAQPTNADKVIGTMAIVTERIDNLEGMGAVSVGGRIWTARSATGEIIEEGTQTEVKSIDGVKLIVIPQAAAQTAEK